MCLYITDLYEPAHEINAIMTCEVIDQGRIQDIWKGGFICIKECVCVGGGSFADFIFKKINIP